MILQAFQSKQLKIKLKLFHLNIKMCTSRNEIHYLLTIEFCSNTMFQIKATIQQVFTSI